MAVGFYGELPDHVARRALLRQSTLGLVCSLFTPATETPIDEPAWLPVEVWTEGGCERTPSVLELVARPQGSRRFERGLTPASPALSSGDLCLRGVRWQAGAREKHVSTVICKVVCTPRHVRRRRETRAQSQVPQSKPASASPVREGRQSVVRDPRVTVRRGGRSMTTLCPAAPLRPREDRRVGRLRAAAAFLPSASSRSDATACSDEVGFQEALVADDALVVDEIRHRNDAHVPLAGDRAGGPSPQEPGHLLRLLHLAQPLGRVGIDPQHGEPPVYVLRDQDPRRDTPAGREKTSRPKMSVESPCRDNL